MRLADGILNGVRAGAAGTTGLNAATHTSIWPHAAGRARPHLKTPSRSLPRRRRSGYRETKNPTWNRVSGLGALNGIVSGVVVGTALDALRSAGWRPGVLGTGLIATLGAMAVDRRRDE